MAEQTVSRAWIVLAVLPVLGCADAQDAALARAAAITDGPCTVLFGLPNAKTGLTVAQCQPRVDCGGRQFVPPIYTKVQVDEIASWKLLNPPDEVLIDPYQRPGEHLTQPGQVCAFVRGPAGSQSYSLQTFADADAAKAAGATLTHYDACGVCSPLVDLAVYMREPDLTDPVRQCGFIADKASSIACLQQLGFDLPCAEIWYFNTQNTRAACLDICMAELTAPYNTPDGGLNACLACDEAESGPIFKAVAGRTRRNTGLPSSICRPAAEVLPVFHTDQ